MLSPAEARLRRLAAYDFVRASRLLQGWYPNYVDRSLAPSKSSAGSYASVAAAPGDAMIESGGLRSGEDGDSDGGDFDNNDDSMSDSAVITGLRKNDAPPTPAGKDPGPDCCDYTCGMCCGRGGGMCGRAWRGLAAPGSKEESSPFAPVRR